MTAAPPDDCRSCARCCFSRSPEHARVFGSDHERMDDRARSLTTWSENRCFMRVEGGRCAALVVTDAVRGLFACSIYDARPDVCRRLERGDPACLGELHAKAGRPEALLAELRTRVVVAQNPTKPAAR